MNNLAKKGKVIAMADLNNYSFIRVTPCSNASRGNGSLGKALGHLDKHKESADISKPELSHLNKRFIDNPKTFRECIALGKELLNKHNSAVDKYNQEHNLSGKKAHRHMKNGTYQFFEGVMTYSPDMEGKIPLDEWSQKSFEFLKKEYAAKGCEILRCDLHCDESSVHMQFVIACFDNKAQSCSYRNLIGGKAALSQLQDRYGETMKPFGLVRGFSRYKENYALKETAAEFYHTSVDKLTKPQWETWCSMHGIETKKAKRHQEISKWKAKQSAKETADFDKQFQEYEQSRITELEQKLQEKFKSACEEKQRQLDECSEHIAKQKKAINFMNGVCQVPNGNFDDMYWALHKIVDDNTYLPSDDLSLDDREELLDMAAEALNQVDDGYNIVRQGYNKMPAIIKALSDNIYQWDTDNKELLKNALENTQIAKDDFLHNHSRNDDFEH